MRLELPSGLMIQAAGWSGPIATDGDERPDWGLYLDEGWRKRVTWPSRFLPWPDFGVPSAEDEPDAIDAIREAGRRLSAGECVEIGCMGGTGRSGTALACLAVMGGLNPSSAIEWVRSSYHPDAIETRKQERFVARFAAAVGSGAQEPDGEEAVTTEDEAGSHGLAVLRGAVLADLDRWEPELARWRGSRSTLWYGIFDKACKRLESLVSDATRQRLASARDDGAGVLQRVGQGKPVEQFTLGQKLDVLRALNKKRSAVRHRVNKSEFDRLERLVALRNDFAHGRLEYGEDAIDMTLAFLADIRDLCAGSLVAE